MSGSLAHGQAKVIQYLLSDLGLGTPLEEQDPWPVFAYTEPSKPDDSITTYDTPGIKHGKTQPDSEVQEHHGVQVRVRSANGTTGRAKARAIAVALDGVRLKRVSVDSSVYLIHSISRSGDVISLGKEPKGGRNLFTVNCVVAFRQVS